MYNGQLEKIGIILRAKEAKQKTQESNATEKVEIAVISSYNQMGELQYGNLEDKYSLENNINAIEGLLNPITKEIENFPVIIVVDGYSINIEKDGRVYLSNNIDKKEEDTRQKEKESLALLEHFETKYENENVDINYISTECKKIGNGSLYLNGIAIKNTNRSEFKFLNDFTIDYWIKESAENLDKVWAPQIVSATTNGIWIGLHSGQFVVRGYGKENYLVLNPPTMDEWVHVAVTRKSGIIYVFYNGVIQGTVNNSVDFQSGDLFIGSDGGVEYTINSYIDELRILNGECKYISNFETSTEEYDKTSGIVYHFNYDEVKEDNAELSMTDKKFGNASKFFNNTYLKYNKKNEFGFSNDFTIDYWIKESAENRKKKNAGHIVVTTKNGIWIGLYSEKFVVRSYGEENYLELDPPPIDEWVHIAITRKNGIIYVFYNGILQGTVNNTFNFQAGELTVGSDGQELHITNSYIDELRILNGYANWTKNFIVSTKAYDY